MGRTALEERLAVLHIPKEVRAVGDSSVMGNLTTGQPPLGLRTCILPAEPVISTVVLEEAEDTFTFVRERVRIMYGRI